MNPVHPGHMFFVCLGKGVVQRAAHLNQKCRTGKFGFAQPEGWTSTLTDKASDASISFLETFVPL